MTMPVYRKLAEGDDPFSALPYEQLFEALAIVKAMAHQHILNGDSLPLAADEFDAGLQTLRRKVLSIQQDVAFADFRKEYGVTHEAEVVMHKVFAAGWDAALGKSFEGGALR